MDKDTWAIKTLVADGERKLRQNVKKVISYNATRKTKITLCVLGSWAIYMPPYNLARLSALLRTSGYETKVYDFNADSASELPRRYPELSTLWDTSNSHIWHHKHSYDEIIRDKFQKLLEEQLDILLADNPDIIGFSCYYTNRWPTEWMIQEIKKRRPDIILIAGGPECAEVYYNIPDDVSFYFVGESEQNIIDFLENWENGIKPVERKIGGLYSDTRIDIDSLPYPDYSDFDFNKYISNTSICAEISRGCVAKCTYCSEVRYWKFRDRGSKNVIDEIEHQILTYGINHINFVDSLMNGNLKEFRNFCQTIIDRGLKFTWWGYARADGRMDLTFYETMAKAGAKGFNIGIESGSDKVLKGINKKNTVAEVNENLYNAAKVGIQSNVCLVLAAPEEDIEAFMHTLTLLWNHRTNIHGVSPGPGLSPNFGSAYDDREKYNMSDSNSNWMSGWWKKDKTNTAIHRMLRVKFCHLWIHVCREFGNGTLQNIHEQDEPISDHFKISFLNEEKISTHIEPEIFDCMVIKSNNSQFANSLMNEVFSVLRLLWRIRGGYEISIDCSDEMNRRDFDFVLWSSKDAKFDALINFKIDDEGNYSADMKFDFKNNSKHIFDENDFSYHYTDSGKWNDISTTKAKKVIFIKQNNTSSVRGNDIQIIQNIKRPSLPLSNPYSGLSYSARNQLKLLANLVHPNDSIIELNAEMGARSAICAYDNPNTKIVSGFLPFNSKEYVENRSSYIKDQIFNEGINANRMTMEECKEYMSNVDNNLDENGSAINKLITSAYSNIITVDLQTLCLAAPLVSSNSPALHRIPSLQAFNESVSSTILKNCTLMLVTAFHFEELEYYYTSAILPLLKIDGRLVLLHHTYEDKNAGNIINFGKNLAARGWNIELDRNDLLVLKRTEHIQEIS